MRRKGLCVTVVIGFSLIWGQALQADEGLVLEKLPDAVQKTIREHRNGVEPSALSREESEGSIFYEAEYLQGDVKHEVKTDEEGRIVEIEEELPLSHLPKAALESIQVAYPGAEIEEVELKTLTHYDIEINLDGKEVNVRILESGYLLQSDSDEVDDEEADEADEEEESEVTWAQLPETVREAIEEHRRGIQPSKFERMEVDGRTFYEAEYEEHDEVKHEVKIDESGQIVEVEDEMPVSKAPTALLEKVKSLHPGASIEEVALKESTYYVVEVEKDDEETEVKVLANGLILGIEED